MPSLQDLSPFQTTSAVIIVTFIFSTFVGFPARFLIDLAACKLVVESRTENPDSTGFSDDQLKIDSGAVQAIAGPNRLLFL